MHVQIFDCVYKKNGIEIIELVIRDQYDSNCKELRLEVVKKAWAFYSYGETRLGQWRENAKTFLKENEKLAKEVKKS